MTKEDFERDLENLIFKYESEPWSHISILGTYLGCLKLDMEDFFSEWVHTFNGKLMEELKIMPKKESNVSLN